MANITIQSLEVESTALNQLSPGEMEKVVGGFLGMDIWGFNRTDVGGRIIELLQQIADNLKDVTVMTTSGPAFRALRLLP
jgi:hypothetical protein